MSLEPSTSAEVVFETTKGPIVIEVWAKEVPRIARKFIENCLGKKYVGISFEKVEKDYLVETGSVKQEEAESFANEFHSRLRFNRRGLVGAIKVGDATRSNSVDGFFMTLKPTPELNDEYVLFGKLAGDSIYNVLKVNNSDLDEDGKPLYLTEIQDIKVPIKYFDELQITETPVKQEDQRRENRKRKKNQIKLGYVEEEGEEEEKGGVDVTFKMKSAHEVIGAGSSARGKRLKKAEEEEEQVHAPDTNENKERHPNLDEAHVQADTGGDKEGHNLELNEDTPALRDSEVSSVKSPETSSEGSIKVPVRDPTIDSEFDSDLDLSDAENIDLSGYKGGFRYKRTNPMNISYK